MEKKKFNKAEYDEKFHRENYTRIVVKFRNTETGILDKLASVPNRTDYIRQLILADIEKEKATNQ